MVTVENFDVLSSDKKHTLKGYVYLPEGDVKGFFQVVHGMAEHIERYDSFMNKMAEEGYICFGYNHLGHKGTVNKDKELGYIAPKNGCDYLVRDVKVFHTAVMEKYGKETKLPYILMGHSMGSFIARLASDKYVKPDRLIVMGTGGPNKLAGLGITLTYIVKVCFGGVHISPMVNNLCFGSFNKHFFNGDESDKFLWLSSLEDERRKYNEDEYCGFDFSVGAMNDLLRMMRNANKKEWFVRIAKKCPVLLVSGAEDPVGNYGRGVDTIYRNILSYDGEVKEILYPSCRHEILNDISREKVILDILDFIK